MNQLSGGKNSSLLLLTALVAALLFAIYYYIVLPKQDEVSSMQSSVSSLQTEVASLQEQIALVQDEQNQTASNTFELRKKVPQDRAMIELLLNIEEIEFVSESRIVSLDFNNYDSLVADSTLQDPNQVEPVEGEGTAEATEVVNGEVPTAEATETTEEATTPPVSTIAREALPARAENGDI